MKSNTKFFVYISFTASVGFLLSFIKILRLPQGGSVSLEALPLLWLTFIFGPRFGILSGSLLGFLKVLFGGYVVHPVQLFLDYPLAYGALGIAGFFKDKTLPFKISGIFLAFAIRLLFHVMSGIVFFSSYAPKGQSPLLYSFIYNFSFLAPEFIVTLIIWLLTFEKIKRAFIKKGYVFE